MLAYLCGAYYSAFGPKLNFLKMLKLNLKLDLLYLTLLPSLYLTLLPSSVNFCGGVRGGWGSWGGLGGLVGWGKETSFVGNNPKNVITGLPKGVAGKKP